MKVTPLYAALLAIWFVVLSVRVIRNRGREKIPLGDGGNRSMLRLMRGHANFAEYVPLALVLMALLELSRFPAYALHALGATLLVARLMHGYALSFTPQWMLGRVVGSTLTFAMLIAASVMCFYQALLVQGL